ncbi:hypothetical protein AB4Y43_01055 [Paraburkholderia sp. BR10872]|uniref:hypothetical protein n=1 Tax=Paraburkholderia sp. BR10872 TaxID=3236989 RepID=UPI0034D1A064
MTTFDQAYAAANAERVVELDDFQAGWDAALASGAAQTPIYQVWEEALMCYVDVTPEYYAERQPSNRRKLYAAPVAPAAVAPISEADVKPLNGIPATLQHDEGAIARCSYCGRYSLDPKTLGSRQPKCDCGEQNGWSGSFLAPSHDAKWSGAAPQPATTPQPTLEATDACFRRNLDLRFVNVIVSDENEVTWARISCRNVESSLAIERAASVPEEVREAVDSMRALYETNGIHDDADILRDWLARNGGNNA